MRAYYGILENAALKDDVNIGKPKVVQRNR